MNSKTKSQEIYIESDITRLVLNHLQFSTSDFSRWLELLDEKAVIEFPYGESAGNAPRLEGKAAIAETISSFFLRVPELRFNNPVVYPTVDPDVAFATYQVEVKVPENGRIYRQKYIGLFRQQNGKLIYISEYFDPTKTIEAFST